MLLSSPVRAFFQLPNGASAIDLIDLLDQQYDERLDGILSSEDSRLAAKASLNAAINYDIYVSSKSVSNSRACALSSDSGEKILIGLIGTIDGPLITDLENLLFWAMLDERLPWHQSLWQAPDERVRWRQYASNAVFAAYPKGLQDLPGWQRMIAAMFGLMHSDFSEPSVTSSILDGLTLINVTDELGKVNMAKARLLAHAVSETSPKWRFLSFYRIVERAYLSNIKRILSADFERDAKRAVETAGKALSNEPNQLVALTESLNLRPEFQDFNDQVDALIATNEFIREIDQVCRDESLYRAIDMYKKGIIRFYKLRCSIAHGGTSSIIFEEFNDAPNGVMGLMGTVERIALRTLGVRP